MKTNFIDAILKIQPKLKGDQLRIVLYLLGHPNASCSDIIQGTGISKSHVSGYCADLYKLGVLKRFETTTGKLRHVKYYINYGYGSCQH